jgi:hypothetical protein
MTLLNLVIVNDCSNVMHDVAPYFDADINVSFINRDRRFWSKTFGLAWQIAKSEGDVFHCNYGLQDAFLTTTLKHLDILHIHGSEIRWIINSKKYGWLVKYALHHANKVLYATPDLETKVKHYREDAIYLPTPIDVNIFTAKDTYLPKPKALYFKQWYESIDTYSSEFKQIQTMFDLTIHERNIPYSEMPNFLKGFDVFIDRFSIPSQSKVCLEAMASGLATIDYRHNKSMESLASRLDELDLPGIYIAGMYNHNYIKENHNAAIIAKTLTTLYQKIVESKK